MHKLSTLGVSLLIAATVATPAMAERQRKTLFQVLFPKAHERQVERQRLKNEQFQRQQQAQQIKKLPTVARTVYYTYKVVARAPITIKPLEHEFAYVGSVEGNDHPVMQDNEPANLEATPASPMTNDLITAGKFSMTAEDYLAKAVSEFYSTNQEFVWIDEEGNWTARARSAKKILDSASQYGLRPSDYAVDIAHSGEQDDAAMAAMRIKKEIAFSVSALRYAMDAKYGTINPNRLSGYHDFPVHYGHAPDVLEKIMGKALPARTLVSMHPQNSKFMALKKELLSLSSAEDDVIDLPRKVLIKPGARHEALPQFIDAIKKRGSTELLEKHSAVLSTYMGDLVYSKEIVSLVKDYQKEAGLGPDGVIGPNTARKLAGLGSEDKKMQVILAMERLRWHPHDLGRRHVFINQPEYRARYVVDDQEQLSMRVIVGKRSNQTNFFYDEIEKVVYNPYWGVPRSIIVNEFARKSLGNPGYLDQRGYEVTTASGKRISSTSVNWSAVGAYPNFNVRQPPGSRNALGAVKILFPNKHSIYMHDTPAKNLFKRETRAFSHGCVRLHDPRGMAAAVLGKSKQQISAAISTGKNATEHLKEKIPVYVSYFTAWPQQDGTVKYFSDVYGRDAHLKKAFEATKNARSTSIAS